MSQRNLRSQNSVSEETTNSRTDLGSIELPGGDPIEHETPETAAVKKKRLPSLARVLGLGKPQGRAASASDLAKKEAGEASSEVAHELSYSSPLLENEPEPDLVTSEQAFWAQCHKELRRDSLALDRTFQQLKMSYSFPVDEAMQVIPEFRGDLASLDSFLYHVDLYAEMIPEGESDAGLLRVVLSKLRGPAATHFRRLKGCNWPQIKDKLEREFGSRIKAEGLNRKLQELRQGPAESFLSYIDRARDLQELMEEFDHCTLSIANFRSQFVAGINSKAMRELARAHKDLDIHDLLEYLEDQYEEVAYEEELEYRKQGYHHPPTFNKSHWLHPPSRFERQGNDYAAQSRGHNRGQYSDAPAPYTHAPRAQFETREARFDPSWAPPHPPWGEQTQVSAPPAYPEQGWRGHNAQYNYQRYWPAQRASFGDNTAVQNQYQPPNWMGRNEYYPGAPWPPPRPAYFPQYPYSSNPPLQHSENASHNRYQPPQPQSAHVNVIQDQTTDSPGNESPRLSKNA